MHSLHHRHGAVVLQGAVPQIQLLQLGLLPAMMVGRVMVMRVCGFVPAVCFVFHPIGKPHNHKDKRAPQRRRQQRGRLATKAVVGQVDLHQARQRPLLRRLRVHRLREHLFVVVWLCGFCLIGWMWLFGGCNPFCTSTQRAHAPATLSAPRASPRSAGLPAAACAPSATPAPRRRRPLLCYEVGLFCFRSNVLCCVVLCGLVCGFQSNPIQPS